MSLKLDPSSEIFMFRKFVVKNVKKKGGVVKKFCV